MLFDLPGCSDPDAIAIGGFWAYRLVSYTTHVADKSDGFIPVNRTRWNASDGYPTQGNTSSNGANVVNKNIYFDGHDEADGGYNHSELRNLTRNYGQQGASMPMKYGKQWIRERLGLLP